MDYYNSPELQTILMKLWSVAVDPTVDLHISSYLNIIDILVKALGDYGDSQSMLHYVSRAKEIDKTIHKRMKRYILYQNSTKCKIISNSDQIDPNIVTYDRYCFDVISLFGYKLFGLALDEVENVLRSVYKEITFIN